MTSRRDRCVIWPAPERVHTFYRLNHAHQTRAFVQVKKKEYLRLDRQRMGIWPALEYLNTLVDDSDPDTELSQIDASESAASTTLSAKTSVTAAHTE